MKQSKVGCRRGFHRTRFTMAMGCLSPQGLRILEILYKCLVWVCIFVERSYVAAIRFSEELLSP